MRALKTPPPHPPPPLNRTDRVVLVRPLLPVKQLGRRRRRPRAWWRRHPPRRSRRRRRRRAGGAHARGGSGEARVGRADARRGCGKRRLRVGHGSHRGGGERASQTKRVLRGGRWWRDKVRGGGRGGGRRWLGARGKEARDVVGGGDGKAVWAGRGVVRATAALTARGHRAQVPKRPTWGQNQLAGRTRTGDWPDREAAAGTIYVNYISVTDKSNNSLPKNLKCLSIQHR